MNQVKITLSLLKTIEEFRDLTVLEWNFKQAIIEKLEQLLEQQKSIGDKEIKSDGLRKGMLEPSFSM